MYVPMIIIICTVCSIYTITQSPTYALRTITQDIQHAYYNP